MTEQSNLKILIADDTDTDRLILQTIVSKEGHQVICARDGVEAVEQFEKERPDIVLLDALMPNLDGFGAARQIKELAGEELIPIIFLTSLTETESLVKCLDAGGDDFLQKPYNRVILQAKIKSFNRMREMHRTMLEQRDQIQIHNNHLIQEQTVAKQVFDNVAHSGCLDAANVRHYLSPMAVFNGDVLVAALRPSGSMMVLLGDFTGHGLPAAIGAMPLASTFYGMVQKGFALSDILREINQKLKSILPVGVFCCATFLEVDFHERTVTAWNGGLPDCLIYRPKTGTVDHIKSKHLPLGVLSNIQMKVDCLHFELDPGDKVYMWSDGIHEARDGAGEMFGEERLLNTFHNSNNKPSLFDDVMAAVQGFIGDNEADDDLSLVEIEMVAPEEVSSKSMPSYSTEGPGLMEWRLQFEILPSTIRYFDPLPLLLNIVTEVPGLRSHSGSLYTILAELYSNALEHGVLGLSSELKASPEGFAEYYAQREERLANLQNASINFAISHDTRENGGNLTIKVKDSGKGFEYDNKLLDLSSKKGYCGRGIPLIRTMCESLKYLGNGNEIEVVYSWRSDR
ncbi:two-component system response regulator HsbR [Aurantivibrio plasticivorans]